MMKAMPLIAVLVLAACSSTGTFGGNSGGQGHGPLLGAYIKSGSLATFEASLGRKLDINHHYASIVSIDPSVLTAAKADIAAAVEPMLSLSAWCDRANSVPCRWADTAAGKYDAQLKTMGAAIAALKAPILVRIMYETPYGTPSEKAAGAPDYSVTEFQNAFNHVCSTYRAAGATNIKCVFNGSHLNYVPSGADILSVDTYNKTTTPEPFQDYGFCQKAQVFHKPLMITETGAGQAEQAEWLSTVTTVCPNLYAFVYWSAPGAQDYTINLPASFAALKALAP